MMGDVPCEAGPDPEQGEVVRIAPQMLPYTFQHTHVLDHVPGARRMARAVDAFEEPKAECIELGDRHTLCEQCPEDLGESTRLFR